MRQLEQKLAEAQGRADLLIAQHRRACAGGKASDAKLAADSDKSGTFDRMKRKVHHAEALSQTKVRNCRAEDMEGRLAALEKEDRIEQLLAELKAKRGA